MTWLQQQQDNLQMVKYHDVQKILWTAHLEYSLDIDNVRDILYSKFIRCSMCCCLCKYGRKVMTGSLLKRKDPRELHFGIFKTFQVFRSQVVHLLDIITDARLAHKFYQLSREDPNLESEGFRYDYNIGFTVVMLAILGPYIIQYSTMMNAIHFKGYFKEQRFQQFIAPKRFYLRMTFTFFGLALMPIIDISLKIQVTILLFLALIPCKVTKKNISLHEWGKEKLEILYEDLFDLNSNELENFEKQKKYIQVIFEDFIMVLLQLFIQLEILNVPKIKATGPSGQETYMSLATTLLSIFTTLMQLFMESKGYHEYACEYIMLSMKAKQDWVPFGSLIKRKTITFDIDYNQIELRYPYFTNLLGVYQTQGYQFANQNLKQLSAILDEFLTKKTDTNIVVESSKSISKVKDMSITSSQMQKRIQSNFIPNLKFGFSLMTISVHSFLTFINKVHLRDPKYVRDKIDMNDIDWERMVQNSLLDKKDLKEGMTDGGKSLIQVIIENEDDETQKWQLQPLMKLLLNIEGINLNILDEAKEYTMLTYCYDNKKHQAFKMILDIYNCRKNIDINLVNPKNNLTIYGMMFYQGTLEFYQDWQPKQKLMMLTEKMDGQLKRHMNQIDIDANKNSIVTPIYTYLERKYSSESSYEEMVVTDKFKLFFGRNEFSLESPQEIQQMIKYTLDCRKSDIAQQLLDQALNKKGNFDNELKASDEQGNNFMHVMGCRFSKKNWVDFTSDKSEQTLVNIVKELMKQKNNKGLTPIQQMLKPNSPLKVRGLITLFSQGLVDIENKDTFMGIESDIIEGFFNRTIDHYNDKTKKDDEYIDRIKFFDSFKDKIQSYVRFKDRFQIANQRKVFDHYFKVDEIEKEILERSSLLNKEEKNLNDETLQQIMRKGQFDNEARVQQQARNLKQSKTISSNINQLLTSSIRKKNEHTERHFILETVLNGLIEISSTLDFISDCVVVYQLSQTIDTAWFSFSLFTMLAPYLTVYSSLMTFKIVDTRRRIDDDKFYCYHYVLMFLMLLPTVLLALIIFDLILMIFNSIAYLIMFILLLTPWRRKFHEWYEEFFNKMYKYTVGMSVMDMNGFKSQRTILQLHLESLPQIFFQLYLLIRIRQLKQENQRQFKVEIDELSIISSISCGVVHVILEFTNLYLESDTSMTNFQDYMVACYSARQGWLPQERDFDKIHDEDDDEELKKLRRLESHFIEQHQVNFTSSDEDSDNQANYFDDQYQKQQKLRRSGYIEFDNKDKYYCCQIGYSVTFEFSNNSIQYLFNIISNMRYIDEQFKNREKIINLGECIKNVKIDYIIQLLRIADRKIDIYFDDKILKGIMSKDRDFLQSIRQPNQIIAQRFKFDEHLIIDMIKMKYAQFVRIMLELKAEMNVTSKKTIKLPGDKVIEIGTSLFQIAYSIRNKKMLAMIMATIQSGDLQFKETLKKEEIFYEEVKQTAINNKKLVQPLILLDPAMLVPVDLLNSFLNALSQNVMKYPLQYKSRWHCLFGAYVPKIDYTKNTDFIPALQLIYKWINDYPLKIRICCTTDSSNNSLALDRQFLSQFAFIRRSFHLQQKELNRSDFNCEIDVTELFDDLECSLQDVLNVYKIYHKQLSSITIAQMIKCDQIVEGMGFDKEWSEYYQNSRDIQKGLMKQEYLKTIEQNSVSEFNYTLEIDVLAIKELRILKCDDCQNDPKRLEFIFNMPHFRGKINSDLPPSTFWQIDQELSREEQEINDRTVLKINYHLRNYDLTEDHRFKNINMLLKNQIKGGHQLYMKVLDGENQPILCLFQLDIYKSMKDSQKLNETVQLNTLSGQ